MKKGLAALAAALLVLVLITVLAPHVGRADLGGFSGDSDYGGGDYGGSDYSSSDSGSSGYSSSRSRGGDSCSDEACIAALLFVIAPISVFVIILLTKSGMRSRNSGAGRPGATRTAQSMLQPIESYKTLDENFSPEDLKEWLQNLYFKMQDCCVKRDVEPIRPYFADSLWQQFDRQMQGLRAARRTNYVERIAVLSVDLRGWYQDKGEDVIVAEIYARITDYTVNDDTGKVISGSKTCEKFMTYEYALSRPTGKKTDAFRTGVSERHCPNCGAPLSVNESIKCPYCGSVLTFGDHDWTVYSIKGISQRTV